MTAFASPMASFRSRVAAVRLCFGAWPKGSDSSSSLRVRPSVREGCGGGLSMGTISCCKNSINRGDQLSSGCVLDTEAFHDRGGRTRTSRNGPCSEYVGGSTKLACEEGVHVAKASYAVEVTLRVCSVVQVSL